MPDLQAFAENLWIVDGPNVRDMGVMFTTRMTVVKLADGSLWVNSPVSVPSDTLKRITELGPVRYLRCRDPEACLAAGGVAHAISRSTAMGARPTPFTLKKGHLPFTGILGDEPPQGWEPTLTSLPSKATR